MSRLAFVADVHVGNPSTFSGPVVAGINTRGAEVLATLEKAVEAAGSSTLVICGDLFDTSSPSPQLIAEVQRILSQASHVVVLLGNHDQVSDAFGDNALGPLTPLPNVMTVECAEALPLEDCTLLAVPFQTGDCREWFPEAVAAIASVPTPKHHKKVLVFHLGIIDQNTPSFLRKAHDAIELEVVQELVKKHGIDAAFCGNWHNPRAWRNIVQCGALCPTGWDNPEWNYGRVWTYDTNTQVLAFREIPGPRFLSVEDMEDAEGCVEKANQYGHKLYLTLKGEAGADPAMLETVREWGVTARAVADNEAAREATRAAASAVKQASTLQSALAGFIAKMPVEEGVDREKIRAMAQKYLAQGGAT